MMTESLSSCVLRFVKRFFLQRLNDEGSAKYGMLFFSRVDNPVVLIGKGLSSAQECLFEKCDDAVL
jgi:hypothetical protein